MQSQKHHQLRWRIVLFLFAGLLVVFVDQLSKAWIRANVPIGHTLFDEGFFRIIHISNTGAAFGLFAGYSEVLSVIAIIGVIVLLFLAFFSRRYLPVLDSMLSMVAMGLVLGGTIGNLIDRLRLGNVTDFIDFKIWPIFNVADSCVTVGIIIIAYSLLRITLAEKQ